MPITWVYKPFKELSSQDLYDIFQLRLAVFVVEQNCPYQDADGKDPKCWHLMGIGPGGKLIAYSRIVPPGVSYAEPSIGRVVSSPEARRTGAGKELMKESIRRTEEQFGRIPIRIGAQKYLEKFYEGFGFYREGEEYLEDGIPHIIMLRKP